MRQNLSKEKHQIKEEIIKEVRRLNENYASELARIITQMDTTTESYKTSHRELTAWMRSVSSNVSSTRQSLRDEIHRTYSIKLYYYIAGIILSGCISALSMYVLLTYL